MASFFPSYPVQGELNEARRKAWMETYKTDLTAHSLANAVIHKEMSVLCLISNTAAAAIGSASFATGATVLAIPKLVTFIVTAGIVRPEYSTGCIHNGGVVLNSITNIFLNALEITFDSGYAVYKTGKSVHWVAKQVGLDGILTFIAKQALNGLVAVAERVGKGTERAVSHEPNIGKDSPMVVAWINDPTRDKRIDFGKGERPIIDIAAHLGLSAINIPVNVVACAGSGSLATPLSACFVTKVAVNAITNTDIPVPTAAGNAWFVCGKTFYNISADIGTIAADTGVLAYKVTNILRINQLVASAVEFLVWSVGAIFS